MTSTKKIIGWREYVDFPEWGIKKLKAKIDTGARSSSLHVEDIKEIAGNKISFYVVLDKRNQRKKIITTPIRRGKVKSSIGVKTRRWYVQTKIRIGDVVRRVRINLTGREEMNFRMLIGRTAIENVFLVDVDHVYLLSKKRPAKKGTQKRKAVKRK